MRRVVITGSGIISCIGNNKKEVLDSLLNTKSGITFSEEYKKYNFKSQVCGVPKINYEELIDRKVLRFMGDGSAYAYLSMKEAIEESGLTEKEVSNEKTGIIIGSGGPSIKNVILQSTQQDHQVLKKWARLLCHEQWQVHVLQHLQRPLKLKE